MVGKRQLISEVDNVASYSLSYNNTNIPRRGSSGSSVVERVCLIGKQTKSHARRVFKTMGEGINSALHAWVVIERVAVKVAELRVVPLEGGVSEKCGNIGLDECSTLKSHEALKTLHKEDDIPIVHVFSYRHYRTFSVCSIKVGVEVAQVGLIPPFCCSFQWKSPPESAFGIASESRGRVAEKDSFRSRNFSIISYKNSFSFLCLAWIPAIAVATADVIALVIDCWKKNSMT